MRFLRRLVDRCPQVCTIFKKNRFLSPKTILLKSDARLFPSPPSSPPRSFILTFVLHVFRDAARHVLKRVFSLTKLHRRKDSYSFRVTGARSEAFNRLLQQAQGGTIVGRRGREVKRNKGERRNRAIRTIVGREEEEVTTAP